MSAEKFVCPLCLNKVEKLEKSHIVSGFIFRHSGVHGKNKENIYMIREGGEKIDPLLKRNFDGPKEKLLCGDCEDKLAVWEDYCRDVLWAEEIPAFRKVERERVLNNGTYISIEPVDLSIIKLFFLSVFWRMSISKLPFFSQFDLGKFHNDRMRNLIHYSDPGPDDQYQMIHFQPQNQDKKEVPIDHMLPFLPGKYTSFGGSTGWIWHGTFGKYGVLFKVSDIPMKNDMKAMMNTMSVKPKEGATIMFIMLVSDQMWRNVIYKVLGVGDVFEKIMKAELSNAFKGPKQRRS